MSLSMNNIVLVSEETRPRRQVPAWLLGLVIAGVLFGVGLIVFQALGFGDNPVLGDTAATLRSL